MTEAAGSPEGPAKAWSRRDAACRGCRTQTRPHHARGYCLPCYNLKVRGLGQADPTPRGRWARRWDGCRACGTEEIPHHAFGLCNLCYLQEWRKSGNSLV